jgi:hypothetical protein
MFVSLLDLQNEDGNGILPLVTRTTRRMLVLRWRGLYGAILQGSVVRGRVAAVLQGGVSMGSNDIATLRRDLARSRARYRRGSSGIATPVLWRDLARSREYEDGVAAVLQCGACAVSDRVVAVLQRKE